MKTQKTFYVLIPALLFLWLGSATAASAATTAHQRAEYGLQAHPGREAIYIDVPAAGNKVSNWMVGALAGKTPSMRQLTGVMAAGATSPITVVVGSEDESLTRKAVQNAMKSFRNRSLPHLRLTIIADPKQAEDLRKLAEELAVEFRVLPPPGSE